MSDSPPSSKEAVRAGVAERWISSQAGTNGNSPCAPPSSSSSSSSCASLPAATVWASFSAASQPPSSSSQGFPSPPTYSFGLQGIAKPIMNLNLAASAMATTDGTLLPETSNVGARSRNSNAFVSPPTSLLRSQPRESELIQGSSRNFYLSPLNDDNPANPSSNTFPSLGMPSSSSSSSSSASDLSYQATDQNPTNGFVAFSSTDLPKLCIQQWEASPTRAVFPPSGNEKLYEAYNELHSLAQDFHKPFDSPAILVVGHQSDGKSALVEALMGFQFNHVGGGTKTRRPITLHMQYSATCLEPRCSLITDERPPREEERTLEELQAYIEAENLRLEREGCQFWAKEIVVKIEYKFCPNLTIIDMPGLIAAASGRKNQLLQAQARAVEALVRTKMQHKEFIILCLEDCSDWSNATTRRIVMQMDPELSRTVVVSTKLDTRIPQFARTADVEMFLHPPSRLLDGDILGETPFFTSIPSGRVGISRDSVYKSNDDFREAVVLRESQDIAALEEKLGRPLSKDERSRVGISRLRLFLEQLLQKRYMENVPLIVPMLDREYRLTTKKLRQTSEELGNLDEAKLKEKGRLFRDSFLAKLSLLLKGTVVAPPDKFGEALQDERVNGGAFVGPDGLQTPFKHMPNAGMRLYGGAQYHRAMAEFRFIVGSVKCPSISREEIVNACGVEDIHDGTNYFRSACVIAVSKARDVFEPFLHQLGFRLSHILRRLLPIGLYLLQKDGEYLSGHNMFMNHVSTAFNTFVESTERSCREKCMEDLMSTTRYVTWSLHNKNRSGLRLFLDSYSVGETSTINPVSGATIPSEAANMCAVGNGNKQDNKARQDAKTNFAAPNSESSGGNQTTQARLVDLLESTLWNRRLAPSSEEIVNALVAQIFEGIRDHFVSSAELKFNCFFLMPVVDKFPARLREDLEVAFEEDLDNVFNVAQARRALDKQKADLEFELRRIERLQENFSNIHRHLSEIEPSAKDFAEEISLLKITER